MSECKKNATKIQELFNEVGLCKQAIKDGKDALASAGMEPDETPDAEFRDALN